MDDTAITERQLEFLVDCLAIPAAQHEKARLMLKQMIPSVLDAHERDNMFERKADRAALKKIGTAARKLVAAIEGCTVGAMYALDVAWPKDGTPPDDLITALDELQNITSKPGKAGHPGPPMAFISLVGWLTGIADKCEGHASIKADSHEGRLVDALNILRDLLPAGVVPDPLPYGTIARWKDIQSARRKRLTIKNRTKITRL